MIARSRGIAGSYPRRTISKKEVPLASYTRSDIHDAKRTVLSIDESRSSSGPVAERDIGRKAVAFDQNVVQKLTPTMRNFTLEGKVAVVTGYVKASTTISRYMVLKMISYFSSLSRRYVLSCKSISIHRKALLLLYPSF